MSSQPLQEQSTVKLTFELPADHAAAAMNAMAHLATESQAPIELVGISPRTSEVPRRWKDSPEHLYTDITYEGVDGKDKFLRIISIDNLAGFARANGIIETTATTVINRLGRALDPDARQRYMYGYFDRIDNDVEEEARRKTYTGVKVETVPELLEKLKNGELRVEHVPGDSLSVGMLEAHYEQLFRDPAKLASTVIGAEIPLRKVEGEDQATPLSDSDETVNLRYSEFGANWSGHTKVPWKILGRYADNDPSFPLEKVFYTDGSFAFRGDIGRAAVWLRRTHPGTVSATILERMAQELTQSGQ